MTYTSKLSDYGAGPKDRVDPGGWFLTKDEPLLAEYANYLFYHLTEDTQWAISMLNAIDPDEDGQVSDAYTLRGQTPSEVGGWAYTQTATPTSGTNGSSWFKDSNGVIFAHDGTEYNAQPELGYDESPDFDAALGDGYVLAHESPARTEVRANSIMLRDELTVADFEDGIKPNTRDWAWTAGTGTLTAQGTQTITGTQSLQMESVATLATATLTRDLPIIQDWEFAVQVGADTANINDYVAFEVADGTTTLATITFNDGAGNVTVSHGDGLGATTTTEIMAGWVVDTTYGFEFDWDFTNNQFDLLDGAGTLIGTFPFEADATAADFVSWSIVNETTNSGNTRSAYVDDLHTGARESGEVVITCPQPDERIVDWDMLQFTRTLATETVQVDVEDETGTPLVTNVTSNSDLSAYVAATTNPQLRITLSRAATVNDPSFDSVYRRWTMRPGDTGLSTAEQDQWKASDTRARYRHTRLSRRTQP